MEDSQPPFKDDVRRTLSFDVAEDRDLRAKVPDESQVLQDGTSNMKEAPPNSKPQQATQLPEKQPKEERRVKFADHDKQLDKDASEKNTGKNNAAKPALGEMPCEKIEEQATKAPEKPADLISISSSHATGVRGHDSEAAVPEAAGSTNVALPEKPACMDKVEPSLEPSEQAKEDKAEDEGEDEPMAADEVSDEEGEGAKAKPMKRPASKPTKPKACPKKKSAAPKSKAKAKGKAAAAAKEKPGKTRKGKAGPTDEIKARNSRRSSAYHMAKKEALASGMSVEEAAEIAKAAPHQQHMYVCDVQTVYV